MSAGHPIGGRRSAPATTGRSPRTVSLSELLAEGDSVLIDGQPHRLLAVVGLRMLLVHIVTSTLFLVCNASAVVGLPDREDLRALEEQGRLAAHNTDGAPLPSSLSPHPDQPGEVEKINLGCDLLDAAGVSNGAKAISIWLHANWRGELAERFGPHSNVHALRRWRSLRARKGPS